LHTVITRSVEETIRLGARLGCLLEPGSFIALSGELGSGKTQFAQGIAAGLGLDSAYPVTSPTFTILNEYPGRLTLYHFDLYRLGGADEVMDLGFEELFYGDGVCVVEWMERLGDHLPAQRLEVMLSYEGEMLRRLEFTPHGSNYEALLEKCFDPCSDSCY